MHSHHQTAGPSTHPTRVCRDTPHGANLSEPICLIEKATHVVRKRKLYDENCVLGVEKSENVSRRHRVASNSQEEIEAKSGVPSTVDWLRLAGSP